MKRNLAFLSLSFSLVAFGCIDPKEIGNTDEGTTGGASESSESDGSAEGSASSATQSGTGVVTESGGDTESSTGSDSEISGTASESGGDTESSTGDDTDSGIESGTGSTSGGGDDQQLCESTFGVWDEDSCDHYTCGFFPDCDAIVPGCDCGAGATFIDGVGCQPDETCPPLEFYCGEELTCDAPGEYCDVFFPGVAGADPTWACVATDDACADDYTCECFEAEGLLPDEADCNGGVAGDGIHVTTYAP